MTTLKDYLNDFTEDVKKIMNTESGEIPDWETQKEDLIEEYLKIITERLIGE